MKVLVINCGSSSLKYQLIDMRGDIQKEIYYLALTAITDLKSSIREYHQSGKTQAAKTKSFP